MVINAMEEVKQGRRMKKAFLRSYLHKDLKLGRE